MTLTQEVYAHIRAASELLMQEISGAQDLEKRIHAAIWPYITHAVRELNPSAIETPVPKRDARTKMWQVVVRFWNVTPLGNNLMAETEPDIVQSTGSLPGLIAAYAGDMHVAEGEQAGIPHELSEESIKEKLPQLRNNLGRQGSGVLRITYTVPALDERGAAYDDEWICQVDVTRLDS